MFYTDNYNMEKRIGIIIFALFFCTLQITAEVYKENAVVSYYAGDFHGKKTSNGEYFNMNDLTCASKSLPFNTVLKVTNLANGKTVQVRVNDRGPFVPGRELDLSKAAAIKLDMIKSGTAHVKIEIVKRGPNTKASQQTAAKAQKIMQQRYPENYKKTAGRTDPVVKTGRTDPIVKRPAGTYWDIQLGSFSTRENANKLAQKLLKSGYEEVVFQKKDGIYRVVIRSVPVANLSKMETKLQNDGYTDYVIRQRKK